MINYSEDRRILKQAIDDNKLVVFVGAGASSESGIPLWNEAVKKIYDKISPTAVDKNETLKIPQIYFNARGEKEYNELIKSIFKYDNKSPNKIHELIVKLNPSHVITTNYDDFLEKAFIANGEFLDVVQKDTEIPYCKNSRMIIKMHGGFIYNNFVLKEDDYLNYSYNFALIETFIKALVVKNVILFIGYSYNDPDTKQIFNWVKNILGDNFQRAYFLDAKNCYDLNIVNYYKNLGINVIYSSECLGEKFDKNNIYKNTIQLLNYIIKDEQETDVINIVYNKSKYLVNLNYVMVQYVLYIFANFDIQYQNCELGLSSNKCENLFKLLNEYNSIRKSIKLSTIKELLGKTMIKNVYIYDNKMHKPKILCQSNNTLVCEKFYQNISDQNFLNIKKYTDSVNISIEGDNQEQLRIAYAFYELHQYQKCYEILKKISLSYKQQKNYIWYFITEFNRLYVGKFINSRIYFNTNNEFENEIEKINLNDILYNNALKGKNENQFLVELKNFTIVYETVLNVIKTYKKVEKDAVTNYVFGSGVANIDILENTVRDFYNYLNLNYFMIDIYSEVKEVFKQYINDVFCSHAKEEKEFKEDMFGPGKNKVLKEISAFDIIIICKYIDEKCLDEIFENNNIKKIILSNDAQNKLFEIFNNYFDAIQNKIVLNDIKNKIFVILKILGISSLPHEKTKIILNRIIDLMSNKYFRNIDYKEISKFIAQKFKFDKSIFTFEFMSLMIDTICNGFRLKIWEDTDISYLYDIFSNISYMLNNIFPDKKIGDMSAKDILESKYVDFLRDLFFISSDNIKEKIKDRILLELEKNDFNSKLYCDAVSADIIIGSQEKERELLKKVKHIYYERNSSRKCFPDPLENILIYCINLYLNGKLINAKDFAPYFKEFPKTQFLYNMNDFNYDKFEISWFTHFSEPLKNIVIKNQIAFTNIKKLYKKILDSDDYDQRMLDEYLRYFD